MQASALCDAIAIGSSRCETKWIISDIIDISGIHAFLRGSAPVQCGAGMQCIREPRDLRTPLLDDGHQRVERRSRCTDETIFRPYAMEERLSDELIGRAAIQRIKRDGARSFRLYEREQEIKKLQDELRECSRRAGLERFSECRSLVQELIKIFEEPWYGAFSKND